MGEMVMAEATIPDLSSDSTGPQDDEDAQQQAIASPSR
jgi:hypothetical protein